MDDADLEDPPEVLRSPVAEWDAGLRHRVRVPGGRNEPLGPGRATTASISICICRILARLSPLAIPRGTGDFCLMSRSVVDQTEALSECARFVRGLLQLGVQSISRSCLEVAVHRSPGRSGHTLPSALVHPRAQGSDRNDGCGARE